jgi:hypothetical protein
MTANWAGASPCPQRAASRRAGVRRLAGVLALCAAATAMPLAATPSRGLTIKIYDMAGVSAVVRHAATNIARAILLEVGIDAEWLDCEAGRDTSVSPCAGPRHPSDLMVRLVRGTRAPAAASRTSLGYSVVETPMRRATLATIFVDRVDDTARATVGDTAELMGRAIAHEVGHLLLGTNSHAESGLMREVWTETELVRNRPDDWLFSKLDRGRLSTAWRQRTDSTRQRTESASQSPEGDSFEAR